MFKFEISLYQRQEHSLSSKGLRSWLRSVLSLQSASKAIYRNSLALRAVTDIKTSSIIYI